MYSNMERLNKRIRRKRMRKLLFVAFLSIALVAFTALLVNIFVVVSVIKVKNLTEYDSEAVLEAAGINIGSPLLSINSSDIGKIISKTFPYIDEVKVKLSFPSKVELNFVPTQPYIAIQSDDGYYLYLDKNLKVLEKTDIYYEGAIYIYGMAIESFEEGLPLDPKKNIETEIIILLVDELNNKNLVGKLSSMDFSKKYNLKLTLEDRIEVELGSAENFDKKLNLLVNILERNNTDKKMSINVRNYTQGRCRIID